MFLPDNTIGWLKYATAAPAARRGRKAARTDTWHRVGVVYRIAGSHTYVVEKNRTRFRIDRGDVLVVVRPSE
jgi:hypothetical protein